MKRMKKKNKMAAFLAAVILMTMSVCQGAFAGETAGIDTARPVSLTIDLEAESKKATISRRSICSVSGIYRFRS